VHVLVHVLGSESPSGPEPEPGHVPPELVNRDQNQNQNQVEHEHEHEHVTRARVRVRDQRANLTTATSGLGAFDSTGSFSGRLPSITGPTRSSLNRYAPTTTALPLSSSATPRA
jgi:hypothetical protein